MNATKHKCKNKSDQMALARESLAIQMRLCNKHDVLLKYIALGAWHPKRLLANEDM